MTETKEERKERIAAARAKNVEVSRQIGFDVASLLVRPVAQEAWERFNAVRQEKGYDKARCTGRESKFADYETPPTDGQAQMMCAGCPFLEECGAFADAEQPAWGIWGGRIRGRNNMDTPGGDSEVQGG